MPSLCYYNDITYAIDTLQPIAYAKCNPSLVGGNLSFFRTDEGNGNFPLVEYKDSMIGSQQWFQSITNNNTVAALDWIELSKSYGNSSIGVVVALPARNTSSAPSQILACTIDARWANATATASFSGGPKIVSGLPKDWFITGRMTRTSHGDLVWPQVNISSCWANNLNPAIERQNISMFGGFANSIGRLNDILSALDTPSAVEAILTAMVAEGMSRVGNIASIIGSLKGTFSNAWMKELLPQKGHVFGNGGSAFNYTPGFKDHATRMQLMTTVNGYGYGIMTATVLSTLVLMVYCFIAISYVTYTIGYSETSSGAWESITELIALGLTSPQSKTLNNIGAGISSLGTLTQKVKIEVADGRVEMKLLQNSGESQGEEVQYNESYG